MRLPYVTPQMMNPKNRLVPLTPFVLSPKNYRFIGGHIIRALASPDKDGRRPEGFSIQTRYEAPIGFATGHELTAEAFGIDVGYSAGRAAADFINRVSRGRSVLIIPALNARRDAVLKTSSGRLVADAYLSGNSGHLMEMTKALSVHKLMLENKHASSGHNVPVPDSPLEALRVFPPGVRNTAILGREDDEELRFS